MWYVIPKDELYHHGILGQKWGVRRYQNPDGTLTAEGRKRYGTGESGASHSSGRKTNKSSGSSSNNKERKKLTDKQKKTIAIVGTAAAATALAAIGGYALYKSGKLDTVIGKAFDFHTGANTFGSLKEKGKKAVDAIKTSWVIKDSDSKMLETAKNMKLETLQDTVKKLNLENAYVKAMRAQTPAQRKTQIDQIKKILTSASGLVIGVEGIKGLINKNDKENKNTPDLSKMSDQELRELINRANLESQYNNMYSNKNNRTSNNKIKKAKEVLDVAQKVASTATGVDQALHEINDRRKKKEEDK